MINSGQFSERSSLKATDQFDQKLVTRIQKGDRTAFDLLLVKYQNKVAAIVSRFVDNQEDIADLTQEIFIKAYRAIHSFRQESTFYTWLYRIAINHAKSFLRQYRPQKVFNHNGYSDEQIRAQEDLASSENPESLFSRVELARNIEEILSNMSLELSLSLMLREFEGLSYKEIAHVMDCPVGTVRSRIFRARELFNEKLSKQD